MTARFHRGVTGGSADASVKSRMQKSAAAAMAARLWSALLSYTLQLRMPTARAPRCPSRMSSNTMQSLGATPSRCAASAYTSPDCLPFFVSSVEAKASNRSSTPLWRSAGRNRCSGSAVATASFTPLRFSSLR